jgi:hypothetical protein
MSEFRADRRDTVVAFLQRSKRHVSVGIRQTFLQSGRGSKAGPGPLAGFVRRRDRLALDLYLLLLLLGRGRRYGAHVVEVQAGTWARVLGLTSASSSQVLSRAVRRLEEAKLISRTKSRKGVRVKLLREDGSGEPYSPPNPAEPYFQLPLAYWTSDDYIRLRMPAKAMLLVALGEQTEFELPIARVSAWYGISAETASRGYDELVRTGLSQFDQRPIKDPWAPTGTRIAKLWRLLDPYAKSPRMEQRVGLRRVK